MHVGRVTAVVVNRCAVRSMESRAGAGSQTFRRGTRWPGGFYLEARQVDTMSTTSALPE